MGEEELKPEETKAEEKKPEEPKKAEEAEPAEKPAEEKKPAEEPKAEGDAPPPPPPPPPPEILLKVFMHCEGCARKVRRCLKGFPGVEEVITDCKSHNVVIKGEGADPLKVVERVQKKSHRKVELVSPVPKPPSEEKEEIKPAAEEEKPKPQSEEKKEEPQIVTVVLKVHMHCEACAQEIERRILRMKGVESAEADLKNSVVSVKGAIEPANLVDHVYKRTGKHAVIVKQEAEQKKQEEGEGGGEKKAEEEEEEEKKEGEEAGATEAAKAEEEKGGKEGEKEEGGEETKVGEVVTKTTTANEYYYYPQRHGMEMYAYLPPAYAAGGYYPTQPVYPPQIFSDENPNACTLM